MIHNLKFLVMGFLSFVLGQEILVYSITNNELNQSYHNFSDEKYSEESLQDIAIHGWVKIGDQRNTNEVTIFYFESNNFVENKELDYSRMSLKIVDTLQEQYFTVSTYTNIPEYNQKHHLVYFDDNDRNSWIFFYVSHSNNQSLFKIYVQFPKKYFSHQWDQISHQINSNYFKGIIGRDVNGLYFFGDLKLFTLHVHFKINKFFKQSNLYEITAVNLNDKDLCPMVFSSFAFIGKFKQICQGFLPSGDWTFNEIKSIYIPSEKNFKFCQNPFKSSQSFQINQSIDHFDYLYFETYLQQQLIKIDDNNDNENICN